MPSESATETWRWDGPERRVLVVWPGGVATRPLPENGAIVIGRGADCDLTLDHPSVSRAHVAVHVAGADVAVEDLKSFNGTRIAGSRIEPGVRTSVSASDVVQIGAARMVIEIPKAARGVGDHVGDDQDDDPMRRLDQVIALVAPADLSIVLYGETGVGKDVIAERIHRLSRRGTRRLVRLNCAAISDTLLESELFGHERGAFTGAVQAKPGLLEAASGGTLLLDEISEMPLATQAKVLRVLEDREVLPVGGVQPRAIDVRFIAATNRDLRALCEREAFRFDLYFRLNGMTITIPPLRERRADIARLARVLLERRCIELGRPVPELTSEALAQLLAHPWPGNVRELRNVLERALVLGSSSRIGVEHLVLDAPTSTAGTKASIETSTPLDRSASISPATGAPLKSEIDALERARVLQALEQCGGNQTKAARMLGMSRRTLVSRLDDWGVPRPRK